MLNYLFVSTTSIPVVFLDITCQLALTIFNLHPIHRSPEHSVPLRQFMKYNWTWLKSGRSEPNMRNPNLTDRTAVFLQSESFNSTNSWETSNKITHWQFFITEHFLSPDRPRGSTGRRPRVRTRTRSSEICGSGTRHGS